jgi:ATP-binding cassette subfamily F protein 3
MALELKHVHKAYGANVVFRRVGLHIERGDRIAIVGPNGTGKSTLMRMLAGVEAPDSGHRHEGHQLVMQYFAQDEAARLDPDLTVYDTLGTGSPNQMVPAIRNILGGFLFSGDDVYKKAGVLSGGERTRLAVARMLLRPSNTLLLDEPTNHLDLDSKDVLLDALEDYGGTLIFVSHDRYFVERLANRIIEVGGGEAHSYPGTYEEFLWRKARPAGGPPSAAGGATRRDGPQAARRKPQAGAETSRPASAGQKKTDGGMAAGGKPEDGKRQSAALPAAPSLQPAAADREAKRQAQSAARRVERAAKAHQARIADLEERIASCEATIKQLEADMARPGFYEDRAAAQPVIDRHQGMMWQVGDLMHQWEALQTTENPAGQAASAGPPRR